MRFSIVTPSYRNSAWLKLCIASVADQEVEVEHIVQDAGSDDGTLDWLTSDPRVRVFVEPDRGMYDALNRGFARAQGEIFAYLNCDEQYLPGTLREIGQFFEHHPAVQVVFGDVVMVDREGAYLWHRKMQAPRQYHTWTCHLSTFSCAMFFRAALFRQDGHQFDANTRDGGDGRWVLRLLQRGVRMEALRRYCAAFTWTGANMSAGANALRENRELRRSAPLWAQALRPLFIVHHRLRRWLGGMYSSTPFAYDVYTLNSPNQRRRHEVACPTFRPPA